jgi:Ca2+-binding RTX toxin-like protein
MTARCESLESRTLLTTAGFKDAGVLRVEANPGDDLIVLSIVPGGVKITVNNETPLLFDLNPRRTSHRIQWVRLDGMGGNDTIRFNDVYNGISVEMIGGDGNDLLESNSARFVGSGGAGDDTLRGSGSILSELEGNTGNDTIIATNGPCHANGGAGRDFIQLTEADDRAWGGPGSDTILGMSGNDTLLGGRGDDLIDAGNGDDWIFGQQGDDTLVAGAGDDRLFGQDGSDSLDGGAGTDVLFTGAGNNDLTALTDVLDRAHSREYRRIDALLTLHVPISVRPT